MPKAFQTVIHEKLLALVSKLQVPDRSNLGGVLAPIFIWDEIESLAKKQSKSSWKTLEDEKLTVDDDALREELANPNGGTNSKVVISSDKFALFAKVTKPREIFDKEAFIDLIATEFNISKPKLIKLSTKCVKNSKAPLTKEVVERG